MKNIKNIISLLEKIQKTNVKLTDIKKITEESVIKKNELKIITTEIREFYLSELMDKILFKDINKINKKLKIFESFLIFICISSFITFILSFVFILCFSLNSNNEDLIKNVLYTLISSGCIAFVSCIVGSQNEIRMISNLKKKIFGNKTDFKSIIRNTTIELVEKIKDQDIKFNMGKENILEYLIEENYLLEKGNENNIFTEIEKEVLKNIMLNKKKTIEDKKILKKEELKIEEKFNYLIKKKEELYK